jgi:hypothetical protein
VRGSHRRSRPPCLRKPQGTTSHAHSFRQIRKRPERGHPRTSSAHPRRQPCPHPSWPGPSSGLVTDTARKPPGPQAGVGGPWPPSTTTASSRPARRAKLAKPGVNYPGRASSSARPTRQWIAAVRSPCGMTTTRDRRAFVLTASRVMHPQEINRTHRLRPLPLTARHKHTSRAAAQPVYEQDSRRLWLWSARQSPWRPQPKHFHTTSPPVSGMITGHHFAMIDQLRRDSARDCGISATGIPAVDAGQRGPVESTGKPALGYGSCPRQRSGRDRGGAGGDTAEASNEAACLRTRPSSSLASGPDDAPASSGIVREQPRRVL